MDTFMSEAIILEADGLGPAGTVDYVDCVAQPVLADVGHHPPNCEPFGPAHSGSGRSPTRKSGTKRRLSWAEVQIV
jgi:hypothetical protein